MKNKTGIVTAICLIGLILSGCAGTQINWNVDKQVVAEVAANEIGYQLAKQYPDEAEVALKYAKEVMESTTEGGVKFELREWKAYLLEKIGADPHYARQLSKLLPELELPETPTPEWVKKVRPYVKEFIYGVEDGLPHILDKYFD